MTKNNKGEMDIEAGLNALLNQIEKQNTEILSRLDVLIHLTLKAQTELPPKKNDFAELVERLYNLGLTDYIAVAKIIEKDNPKSVGNVFTRLKKMEKKSVKKKVKGKSKK